MTIPTGSRTASTPASTPVEGLADVTLRYLHRQREALLWKLEGLPESELRRPLTPTGTNLLGLVKHLAGVEFGYFQMCLGRPVPALAWLSEDAGALDDMYATAEESAEQIVALYRQAGEATDATVAELGPDAPVTVPWWGGEPATIGVLLVHVAVETARHAGHADIVRELLDGAVGWNKGRENLPPGGREMWDEHLETLRTLAKQCEVGALEGHN